MGKPTFCIGENKDAADQLRGNREADQRLCFRYKDSTIPLPSYREADQRLCFRYKDSTIPLPKFQVSISFLCFHSPVCVGPVRKPHCWFSHEAAQLLLCEYIMT